MKETISYIIDTYGTKKIHYSVLVYGDLVTKEISFEDTSPSAEELKTAIDKLPASTGTPDLAKALEEAVKMFVSVNRRPLTRKVRLEYYELTNRSAFNHKGYLRTGKLVQIKAKCFIISNTFSMMR